MIGKYLRYQPFSPQNEHLDGGRMKRTTEPTNFRQFKTARYQIMIIFVDLKNYKIITKAEIVKEVSNIGPCLQAMYRLQESGKVIWDLVNG